VACCGAALAAGLLLSRRVSSGVAALRRAAGPLDLQSKAASRHVGAELGSAGWAHAMQAEQHAAERELYSAYRGQCPGDVEVEGYGAITLVNAKWNVPGQRASPVFAKNKSSVVVNMDGRTYFAKKGKCSDGNYSNRDYISLKLLGKALKYTVDLSGAGCGCNAALSLVPMRGSKEPSECEDYFCDSMQVCGVACAEIAVQEANTHAWLSTMHLSDDATGASVGYGGDLGKPDFRDWGKAHYGPAGKCINTSLPFDVEVSFPTDNSGRLRSMEVQLSQAGSPCEVSASNDQYLPRSGREALSELTRELDRGVTPVMTYWSSAYMGWLDGPGKDKEGPCGREADNPSECGKAVKFYNFQIREPVSASVSVHLNRL